MPRICVELERAGWRLNQIKSTGYAPCPTAHLAKESPFRGLFLWAALDLDLESATSGDVEFRVVKQNPGDVVADDVGRWLGDAQGGLLSALERCPNRYPLSRSEHAAQRRKMIADPSYRRLHQGALPAPETGFPEVRHAAAAPTAVDEQERDI